MANPSTDLTRVRAALEKLADARRANRDDPINRDADYLQSTPALTQAAAELHGQAEGWLTTLLADLESLTQALGELRGEIAEAREACPAVCMQDYFDAPLITLVREEISQLFRMQSRAEQAEQALREAERDKAEADAAVKAAAEHIAKFRGDAIAARYAADRAVKDTKERIAAYVESNEFAGVTFRFAIANGIRQLPDAAPASCCEWTQDSDGSDYWYPACDKSKHPVGLCLPPLMNFCPGCGRPLRAIPHQPEADAKEK